MKKILPVLLIAVFVLGGCMETQSKGYVNPTYKDKRLNEVFVHSQGNEEFNEMLYDRIRKDLDNRGIKVVTFNEMFPPFKKYPRDKVMKKVSSQGFDAVIAISFSETKTTSYQGGQVHYTAFGSGGATTVSSGGMYQKAVTNFSASAYDGKTLEQFYNLTGSVLADGSHYVGRLDYLADEISKSVIDDMAAKGLLK